MRDRPRPTPARLAEIRKMLDLGYGEPWRAAVVDLLAEIDALHALREVARIFFEKGEQDEYREQFIVHLAYLDGENLDAPINPTVAKALERRDARVRAEALAEVRALVAEGVRRGMDDDGISSCQVAVDRIVREIVP